MLAINSGLININVKSIIIGEKLLTFFCREPEFLTNATCNRILNSSMCV
jgi:hypothetical protein